MPKAAARASLAIVSRSVTVTAARVAAVKLSCGSQARCRGTLTLAGSGSGKKLGTRAFSVAAGRTKAVRVKLTVGGFKLLLRVKRLPARVRISYRQPAGGTTTTSRTITLVAPRVS